MALFNSLENKNFISQIQRILRDLNYLDTQVGGVGTDGIYDDGTKDAVIEFQKKYGVAPTGIVDSETWTLLNAVWNAKKEASVLARAVYILPRFEEYEIRPWARDNVVYVIQHMLETISTDYENFDVIELTGIYDSNTQNAIKDFQRRNLLDDNGVINAVTFNRLADEYERVNSYSQ